MDKNNKKKRILIIAHFCDYGSEQSNNRFNYLAQMLADNAYEVELVTSSFSHRDKQQRREGESSGAYQTTLVYEPSYQKNISLKRLLVSHKVAAANLKKYLKTCQKPDLVYCAIPSADYAQAAKDYAIKNKIPFVIDVQDLWPEAYRLILKNELLYRTVTAPMTRKIDKIYAAADGIVAVSQTYADRALSVNDKCKKNTVVFLGTEKENFLKCVRENTPQIKKAQNEVWLGYCGTLGHSYDLGVVFDALELLQDKPLPPIRLIVMGSGPLEAQFKARAAELKTPVEFTGKLPYASMCAQLYECDIALNPIAKGAAQSVINKHADYAMAGLPVVSTQENEEYRALLRDYDCGINCAAENAEQVAKALDMLIGERALRERMGENAVRMAEEKFNRSTAYRNLLGLIETLL